MPKTKMAKTFTVPFTLDATQAALLIAGEPDATPLIVALGKVARDEIVAALKVHNPFEARRDRGAGNVSRALSQGEEPR